MYHSRARLIRKIIHLFTGLMIFVLTYILNRDILLMLIVAGTLFSFITYNYKNFNLLHKTADASLGTLFYPLGILSAFLLLYSYPIHYFQISLMVLAISDPVANLSGQLKPGNRKFMVWHDTKSLYGVIGFAFSTFLILTLLLPGNPLGHLPLIGLVLLLALAFELISYRGSDNFTIPFGLAAFFVVMETHDLHLLSLTGILLVITLGCYFLHQWKVLTRQGSLTVWILGIYFTGVLGYQWLFPVQLFFITSVMFTRLHTRILKKPKEENCRNTWQVLANILWALLSSALYLFTGKDIFIYFFIVSVAAVAADTWASELGPVFNRKSFSLADWKMHDAGYTGGISLAGTMTALAASFSISIFSYWLFFGNLNSAIIGILTLSGFLSCFADTLLGSFLENKMLNARFFTQMRHQYLLSPNDFINLMGSSTAIMFFYIFYFILYIPF